MRKFTFILSLLVAFAATVMAQSTVNLSFTRTDQSVAIAVTDENGDAIEGASAQVALSGSTSAWKSVGELETGTNIICPDVNANTDPTIEMTFTISGVSGLKFNSLGLDIHAMNGSGNHQGNGATEPARLWNVAVLADGDNFASYSDLEIANSCVTDGVTHKVHEAADVTAATAGDAFVLKLTITKGSTNGGCFFGLANIALGVESSVTPDSEVVEIITDLAQLSNDRKYFIESARCFLMYSESVATALATSNGTAVGTVEKNAEDAKQQFKIEKDGDAYYLYSVGAAKYVSKSGAFVDTKTDALTLENVGGTYQWKLCIGGNGLNSQDPDQMANGIVVNNWTTTDAGNCYKIIDAEYAFTAEMLAVKAELDAMKIYAENAIVLHSALTTEQITAINNAITAANTAYEAATAMADIANVRTLIAAIESTVGSAIYLQSLDDLSNTTAYVVSNTRGAWVTDVVDEVACLSSTTKKGVDKDITSTDQHFAFITSPNDYIYLYSVADKKFVSKSGQGTILTDAPVQNVYFQNGTVTGYPWVVTLEDGSQMGISNGYNPAVITFWNDLGDQGNCVNLEAAATFDPTEPLAVIATYESTLVIPDPEVIISSLADANPNKAYTATTQRASWAVGTDVLGVTTALDKEDKNHQFAFIKGSDDNYYLWSVGAGKFVTSSKALSTTVCEPIMFHDGSSVEAGRVMVQFVDNEQGYINITGAPALTVDGWNAVDAGNAVKFVEVADFDPATAEAALEAYLTTGVYKEELNAVVAELDVIVAGVGTKVGYYASSDADYVSKLAAIKEFVAAMDGKTVEEIQAQTTAAEALKATFSLILPTAGNYYFIKNNTNVWTSNDLAVYANGSAPEWKAFDENNINFWWKAETVEGGVAFKNVATGTYLAGNEYQSVAWTLSETATAITFGNMGAANGNAIVSLTLGHMMHANGHGGGANTSGNIVGWDAQGASTASGWELVDGDGTKLAALYRSTVEDAVTELNSMKGLLGDSYGSYSCNEELKAQVEAFDVADATYEELVAMYAVIGQLRSSFKINTPVAGVSYVRIKAGVANWNDDAPYLGSANSTAKDGRAEFIATADANSIFFYCEEKCLVSYASGNHLVNNNNFLGYNSDLSVAGTAVSFGSDATFGRYAISFIGNNEGARALYIHQDNYTDAATPGATGDGYVFALEAVTSLPVTVTSAGYATFYAPVAVTIPTGVQAFYATAVNGDYVSLVEVTGTIPANTGVILKAEAATYSFVIAEDVDAIENNLLDGTIAKEVLTKEGTGNYYVLGVVDGVVGMYNPVNGEDNTTFINAGHKAYMYVEGAASSAGYRFDFSGTTGISEVETENAADAVIYDLTGRRVNDTNRPGIYIVNGKKILVK